MSEQTVWRPVLQGKETCGFWSGINEPFFIGRGRAASDQQYELCYWSWDADCEDKVNGSSPKPLVQVDLTFQLG